MSDFDFRGTPADDLALVRDVIARTQRRIDAHAYQFVWWGGVVLLWYPLANVFHEHWGAIMAVALTAGVAGSMLLGWRHSRRTRLAAENTAVGRQLVAVVAGSIGTGALLSVFGPASGFVDGRDVPTVWALVYAAMTFMVGVVYSREWFVSSAVILAAALVAMFVRDWNGVIVGVPMGLGLIVPGLAAERRVARLRAQDESETPRDD